MSPDATSPAGEPDLGQTAPDFEPERVRMISDLETLRAISDPTRLRILETMVARREPAWSVKELAAALGVPPTRLYHHVELLAERDLVRATERRVVSGIIETRYRVTAQSFQLHRNLISGTSDESRAALHETMLAVFDTARNEIERAVRREAANPDPIPDTEPGRLLVSRGIARLTPARAAEFQARLRALEAEFGDDTEGDAHGIVLAVYPMPGNEESPS